MKKRILFFSCEPGGAAVLIPVIRQLREEEEHQVTVTGYGLGGARFAADGIDHVEVDPVQKDDWGLLERHRPDLVITSATSLPERDMSEKHLWQISRTLGIPTLAFLDQWQNYAVRFSGAAPGERLAFLPDYINCIEAVGEAEMIGAGIDPHRLFKFGHPYLSTLDNSAAAIDKKEVRQRLGIGAAQPVALFVSEAILEHYGRTRGYHQYDALNLFLDLLSESEEGFTPLIKLHPKDSTTEYQRILARCRRQRPVLVSNELTSIESITISDVVYGMTSIMLIEAFVLGKRVISLQPGLVGEDGLLLSRHGIIEKITDRCPAAECSQRLPEGIRVEFDFGFKAAVFRSFLNGLLN